jgi:hypothetical protein
MEDADYEALKRGLLHHHLGMKMAMVSFGLLANMFPRLQRAGLALETDVRWVQDMVQDFDVHLDELPPELRAAIELRLARISHLVADRAEAPAVRAAEEPSAYEAAGAAVNDQLYTAIRAGMAGCQIGLNVAVKLIQTLQLSGVISAEAARELWLQLEDETFRAVESVPALSQSLDAWLIQGRRLFL